MAVKIYRSPLPDVQLARTDLFTYLFSNPHGKPPSAHAFIEAETGRFLSRGQVESQTKSVARGLYMLGIGAGDVVAVFSPNTIDYPICCYAALYNGAIVSPINAALTAGEVHSQLNTGGAKVLFVHSSLAQTARTAAKGTEVTNIIQVDGRENRSPHCDLLLWDLLQNSHHGEQVRVANRKTEDTAFICFSSGTSGPAKGVMLTHGNIIANIQQWDRVYHYDIPHSGVTVNFLPFSHIYGLNVFVLGGFQRGQTCIVLQHFTMDMYLQAVHQYRPEDLYLVPPVAIRLVRDSNLSRYDLRSVKRILSAAAPLTAETATKIEAGFQTAYSRQVFCQQSWGMTETSPLATGVPTSLLATQRHTVGVLAPNMELRLVDPDTMADITEIDEDGTTKPGEILCRGPNVTPGYLNNPTATAELFFADAQGIPWLRTGDIGTINTYSSCVSIKDRIKEMIKYKGFQVVPSELEGTLLAHPDIDDCGVTAYYDDNIGTELPIAFVVLKPNVLKQKGSSLPTVEQSIQKWLNARVANHKRLRGGIRFVDEIPKSPSGKILRRILKAKVNEEGGEQRTSKVRHKL